MRLIRSNRCDARENLVAEALLLDDENRDEPVVFIYRNEPAVVIGKNQNPWRECAVSRLDKRGVRLARRITGGGAVYHDTGNLNIALIVPRMRYRRDDVLQSWVRGLAGLGLTVALAGTTSLAVEGRKISGQAFCYRRDRVLHHGTLLWQADLESLREALIPDIQDVETRAVASVPMPVENLAARGHAPADLEGAVVASLASSWGEPREEAPDIFNHADFPRRIAEAGSWEWLFGATPDFCFNDRGAIVHVHRGQVVKVEGDSAAFKVGQRLDARTWAM
ncbi:MAG TPA: biotin/lipoate A/B protein ligase family protein [Kiritimatiellia bacterium]|nr:biotin/lipoate A/B protein ligase family protein [Kiritimatiellia bacterium]